MPDAPSQLQDVADQLRRGETPNSETVRRFLWWFSASRRGYWIVRRIRRDLEHVGVRTEPDFESAYIDAQIEFRLVESGETVTSAGASAGSEQAGEVTSEAASSTEQPSVIGGAVSDPTYRIGKLPSANKLLLGVSPECTLTEAITHMLANDYSQLPVWQNERTVKGMVSWASIGARLALNQALTEVREFMEPCYVVSADESLFAAIPTIIEHQYVLVRGSDGRITGIVTTSDLSMQFQQLAEPFLLLGEIENHIRRLVDGKFTSTELVSARDPNDPNREVTTVADLSFGEHVRLLENPNRWNRVGLGVDRTTFAQNLDKVRLIRNDVMHFDPDGIADDDLHVLRRFVSFLQRLRNMGAA